MRTGSSPERLREARIAAVARTQRVEGADDMKPLIDRLLIVDDVIAALQTLARKVYEQWGQPVIGITGSAGKTTDQGINGARAVALRLPRAEERAQLQQQSRIATLSFADGQPRSPTIGLQPGGARKWGCPRPRHEIRRLVQITPPDVGVELMVAPVHLEHLGTIETVAAMKAELIEGLKPGGVAVLNADDKLVMEMKSKTDAAVLTFGMQKPADVTATEIDSSRFGSIRFRLRNSARGSRGGAADDGGT
jgi:UDP-N-acetylmuramoyl-tripeptide--D-alanyl-D-alanine ligase